jgi:flagellar hook-associated protein 3 FlgL
MRVSSLMLVEHIITNLQRSTARLLQQQDQVSSGKRLRRPSDDPAATERALRIRAQLGTLEQHLRNIDAAQVWLATTDKALENIGDILHRARELTVQARSSVLRSDDRQAISREVDELLKRLVELTNTQLTGRYLFGGFKTTTPAFTATTNANGQVTAVTYNGDSNALLQNIDNGVNVPVNVTGDEFEPAAQPPPGIFTTLIALRDELAAGTVPSDTVFQNLDLVMQRINDLRARVGATLNRVDQTADRLGQVRVSVTELLSKAEDLDMAEAIMVFNTQQAVFQAALGTAARVIQPSLLDFLR